MSRPSQYRITDPDYKTITSFPVDSYVRIFDIVADEVGCDADDLRVEEQMDDHGEWTGEETITLDGAVVGRIIYEIGI